MKIGLIRSLGKYYNASKEARHAEYDVFDSTPVTFIVKADKIEENLNILGNTMNEISATGTLESMPEK
jgi:hypothetical protein